MSGQVSRADPPRTLRRPSCRLRAGDEVVMRRPAPVEPAVNMSFVEVYRDEALLVIDKPAGLPVHPTARYHLNTLTAVMRTRLGDDHGWDMAHRLDRETSGVMVFGRRGSGRSPRPSGAILKRAFAERRVRKTYLALVHGTLGSPRTIDLPLGPALGSQIRIKMGPRTLADGGLPARTDVVPEALGTFRGNPVTLVRCLPKTGRQHQIRVHLAAAGYPIVGDKLYSVPETAFLAIVEQGRPMAELEQELGLTRHALHAVRLELPHPCSQTPVAFTAPWPDELAAIVPLPAVLQRSLREAL